MRQFPLAHKFSVADNNRQNTGGKGAVSILLGIADQPDSFAVDGKIRILKGGKNRVGRRFVARSIAIAEDCIKNNIRKKVPHFRRQQRFFLIGNNVYADTCVYAAAQEIRRAGSRNNPPHSVYPIICKIIIVCPYAFLTEKIGEIFFQRF